MTNTADFVLKDYCEKLSVKEPVPGGGSVCGVYGAVASSLVLMVLSYTIGKDKFEEYREELETAQAFFEDSKETFFTLSDADIDSYGQYSAGGEQRDSAIFDMIETPLEAISLSVDALELMEQIKEKTNQYLINDFMLAWQSFFLVCEGAEHNLKYNLESAKDEEFVEDVLQQHSMLLDRLDELKQDN